MRKFVYLALLIVMLTAAACTNKTPAATPTVEPTATTEAATETTGLQPGECQVVSGIFPAFKDASAATYAPISSNDWIKGPANATVTVIEFSDYT